MNAQHPEQLRQHGLFRTAFMLAMIATAVTGMVYHVAATPLDSTPITVITPHSVAGYNGEGDERDVDLYPALAYDPVTQRYLAVWSSLHNADSGGDGFDVFGIFLDQKAQPVGTKFRISDSNTVARSSRPAVAAGNGDFVVTWTARGAPCRLYTQQVNDATTRPDRSLNVGSTVHQHSPRLVYNATRQRFVLIFVVGDDYLPPTLFGGEAADCGNNANSSSQARVAELHFVNDLPVIEFPLTISEAQGGAFRPALAYSAGMDQYLAVWEDRRSAAGEPYLFDVYGQRLDGDLTADGTNLALATGNNYVNSDTSATWTPRPAIAGNENTFLATWFEHESADNADLWRVQGQLVATNSTLHPQFQIAEITLVQPIANNAPTGFLDSVYHPSSQEFLVAMTSHIESVFGYFSSVRIQRINAAGQLLKLNGAIQDTPGIGAALDFANDDQITIAMAVNNDTGYTMIYGKHAPGQHSQDFDVWSSRILLTDVSTSGDCNADQAITASDVTALALEFFDGDDNSNLLATSGGSYPGSPSCDANEDRQIGASDVTCIARLFFNGAGACRLAADATVATQPVLSMPSQIAAETNSQVTVPIELRSNGSAVGSLLFSVDYDETTLTFDPADHDQDGIPDAITFHLPAQMLRSVSFDPTDHTGELDLMLADFAATPAALPTGPLVSITLKTGAVAELTTAVVKFADRPAPSFGGIDGQNLAGASEGGTIFIHGPTDLLVLPLKNYLPLVVGQE